MQEQCSNVAVEMLESAADKLAWNSADTRTYNQHRLYTSIMYHVCGVQIEIFYPVEIKKTHKHDQESVAETATMAHVSKSFDATNSVKFQLNVKTSVWTLS